MTGRLIQPNAISTKYTSQLTKQITFLLYFYFLHLLIRRSKINKAKITESASRRDHLGRTIDIGVEYTKSIPLNCIVKTL